MELAKELAIPTENLVTPEFIKRVCWQDPPATTNEYEEFTKSELIKLGARNWQVEQVGPLIAAHLGATEPVVLPEASEGESEPEIAAK